MHQPLYKSAATGDYLLPWVRLHATKGYLDIATMALKFPDVGHTINLVPSLLLQIQDYLKGEVTDRFRVLSIKPASELSPEDKAFILQYFFSINWDTSIKPWPRYWSLLRLRGLHVQPAQIEHSIARFTERDFRDLQVLFNLAWCGFTARKDPSIAALIEKGKDFSEDDKQAVAEFQNSCLAKLLDLWREIGKTTRTELSTTPFYHPILPLLADSRNARNHVPQATLDRIAFAYPEDAAEQIGRGISFMTQILGYHPRGMWPSEGSVSPDLVAMFKDAGVRWIATDQAILERSEIEPADAPKHPCCPYELDGDGRDLAIFFRNTSLSDAIGFRYHRRPGKESAAEFLDEVQKSLGVCEHDHPPVIPVILDGENPWEYYADGGEEFLNCLFEALSDEYAPVKPITFSGYLERFGAPRKIKELYPGSWIRHDFSIWIGDPEKDKAWQLLAETRKFAEKFLADNPDISDETRLEIKEHIFAAEGSDWFWWYGDPFNTEYDSVFDLLFRQHLVKIYELLDQRAPVDLLIPICEKARFEPDRQPADVVEPILDGKVSSYFEWVDAGLYRPRISGTVMARDEAPKFEALYWGYDGERLFIRADIADKSLFNSGHKLVLRFYHPPDRTIVVPLDRGRRDYFFIRPQDEESCEFIIENEGAVEDVIEVAIPFAQLGARPGEIVNFAAYIARDQEYIERCPFDGTINLTCPAPDFRTQMWKV